VQHSGPLAARVATAVVSAAAAAGLTAASTRLWDPSEVVLGALIAVVAVTAVVGSTASAWRRYRTDRTAESRERLAFLLRGGAFAVADATDLDVRDLGVSVWAIGRRRLPWRPAPLKRLHRERVGFVPGPSRVRWRVGVGVVGRCVATGRELSRDVGADWRSHRDVPREEWDSVPVEVSMGLAHGEFAAVASKYGLVRAVPMIVDGTPPRVIGCVTLDGPEEAAGVLDGEPVGAILRELAESVVRLGGSGRIVGAGER
jgi:hypothetical protein